MRASFNRRASLIASCPSVRLITGLRWSWRAKAARSYLALNNQVLAENSHHYFSFISTTLITQKCLLH